MKISDTPFIKTTPYFTNPSLFMGKIWNPLFSKTLKTQTPPPLPPLLPPFIKRGLQLCYLNLFKIKFLFYVYIPLLSEHSDDFQFFYTGLLKLVRAYSRPNLVSWFLKKIFSLEMVKNDIFLGSTSNQNALFSENVPKKTHPHTQSLE